MGIVERIKKLASEKKMTITELERKLDFANSSIRKWDNQSPSSIRLQKVADYFDVSVDYLLGRDDKKYYELNEKDEKDIAKKLEDMIGDLENNAHFSKEDGDMDENTKQLLIMSLENSLRIAKQEAKKKFTPKKYRN